MNRERRRPDRAAGSEPPQARHPSVREVFRGHGLWVLNKPAGVLSHPNAPARRASNTVLRLPYDGRTESYSEAASGLRYELLHRLDQDTSGLILLALDPELGARLKEMFYRHEITKEYRALVRGVPTPRTGVWSDSLRKTRASGQLRVEVVRGAPSNAETRYRVVRAFPGLDLALVAFSPETGRTHQLRVQSAARRHPIAGDERYGEFAWNRELKARIGLRRMFLHAERVVLRHPLTGERLRFVAELGPSLEEPLGRLEALERGHEPVEPGKDREIVASAVHPDRGRASRRAPARPEKHAPAKRGRGRKQRREP